MALKQEQLHGNNQKSLAWKMQRKNASMETVQPDGGRADRAAVAGKPHQWKRSLIVLKNILF